MALAKQQNNGSPQETFRPPLPPGPPPPTAAKVEQPIALPEAQGGGEGGVGVSESGIHSAGLTGSGGPPGFGGAAEYMPPPLADGLPGMPGSLVQVKSDSVSVTEHGGSAEEDYSLSLT